MEHKLVTGGNEYLPFARSCVTKLKKLGLPYADQSYQVGGASIKVRIEPGHEYIRIDGGGEQLYIAFARTKATTTNSSESGGDPYSPDTNPWFTIRNSRVTTEDMGVFKIPKVPGKVAVSEKNCVFKGGITYTYIYESSNVGGFSGTYYEHLSQTVDGISGNGPLNIVTANASGGKVVGVYSLSTWDDAAFTTRSYACHPNYPQQFEYAVGGAGRVATSMSFITKDTAYLVVSGSAGAQEWYTVDKDGVTPDYYGQQFVFNPVPRSSPYSAREIGFHTFGKTNMPGAAFPGYIARYNTVYDAQMNGLKKPRIARPGGDALTAWVYHTVETVKPDIVRVKLYGFPDRNPDGSYVVADPPGGPKPIAMYDITGVVTPADIAGDLRYWEDNVFHMLQIRVFADYASVNR